MVAHRAVMFNRLSGVQKTGRTPVCARTHFRIPWFQTPHVFDVRIRPRKYLVQYVKRRICRSLRSAGARSVGMDSQLILPARGRCAMRRRRKAGRCDVSVNCGCDQLLLQ